MTKELEAKVERLESEITALRTDVKDLVDAWAAAKGMTSFVKWLASLATAGVVIYNVIIHGSPK